MCFENYCNNIGCVFQFLEYFKFLKQVFRKPSLKNTHKFHKKLFISAQIFTEMLDNTISYKVEKKVCCRKVKFIFNN